jgi:hypothetical protein
MTEMLRRIRTLVTNSSILIKTWNRLRLQYKDTLGRSKRRRKQKQQRKTRNLRNLRKRKKIQNKNKKGIIEKMKRIKRSERSSSILIRIWNRLRQRYKDTLERSKPGKRRKPLNNNKSKKLNQKTNQNLNLKNKSQKKKIRKHIIVRMRKTKR